MKDNNTADDTMKNESKQTLISLSLAGAIGYYLYTKLVKAGLAFGQSKCSADDRTKDELQWQPAPVEDTIPEEETIEFVDDTELTDETVEEEVDGDLFEDELEDEEDLAVETVVCAACGYENVAGVERCGACGSLLGEDVPVVKEEEDLGIMLPTLDDEEEITPVVEETPIIPIVEEEVPELDESLDDVDLSIEELEPDALAVDDLLNAVDATKQEPTLMENVEPLHKVDNTNKSDKQEFDDLMDFMKTL